MKGLLKLIGFLLFVGIVYLLIVKPDILINPDKPNAAAEGFSRFYSDYRSSVQKGRDASDYIITIKDTRDELIPRLRRRALQVEPVANSWRGENTRRRFEQGQTIQDLLQGFAQREQMQLFWALPRDYVVKQFFVTNGTLFQAVQELTNTISPDFKQPLHGYFCPKSRALVVTYLDDPYLAEQCIATGSNGY